LVLLRFALGFLLVILGLAYLFHPQTIFRFNAFMRETFFKDSHVLLNQKRIGTVLMLIGFILWFLTLRTAR